MTTTAQSELVAGIDAAPLRPRYWASFGLVTLQLICEIFDFFVVGYLVSALAPAWKLSFGQSTIMLLSAGVGAIFGAIGFGWLADRIGRKRVVVATGIMCSLCAGSLAFTPEGGWQVFALLRFLVGIGYGGAGASQFALITEYTPASKRTLLNSSLAIPAGVGLLVASLVVSNLFPVLGWRGTAALGFAPILVALAIAVVAPESARWLAARGQLERARKAARSMSSLPDDAFASAAQAAPPTAPARVRDLLDRPRRFWLVVLIQLGMGTALTGVVLWGPTILAQLLRITPQQAAADFVFVSLSGLAGRMLFTVLPQLMGRVPTGQIAGYAGAAMLALAAIFHNQLIGAVPAFFIFLVAGQFFYDGAQANALTYSTELHPVRLAALGSGLSAASGGIGKIVGPLALGLIAGADNLVSPHATEQAVEPAFLFLAGGSLLLGLAYTFLGIETHRRPMELS